MVVIAPPHRLVDPGAVDAPARHPPKLAASFPGVKGAVISLKTRCVAHVVAIHQHRPGDPLTVRPVSRIAVHRRSQEAHGRPGHRPDRAGSAHTGHEAAMMDSYAWREKR